MQKERRREGQVRERRRCRIEESKTQKIRAIKKEQEERKERWCGSKQKRCRQLQEVKMKVREREGGAEQTPATAVLR